MMLKQVKAAHSAGGASTKPTYMVTTAEVDNPDDWVRPQQIYRSMQSQLRRDQSTDPLWMLRATQAEAEQTGVMPMTRAFTLKSHFKIPKKRPPPYKRLPVNSFYADSRYFYRAKKEVRGEAL